ncbi:MAG: hypothetical protein AB7V77_01630 [Candidatus Woesearchaeota archaeon]
MSLKDIASKSFVKGCEIVSNSYVDVKDGFKSLWKKAGETGPKVPGPTEIKNWYNGVKNWYIGLSDENKAKVKSLGYVCLSDENKAKVKSLGIAGLTYAGFQAAGYFLGKIDDFQGLGEMMQNASNYASNIYLLSTLKNDKVVKNEAGRQILQLFLGGLIGYNLVQDFSEGIKNLPTSNFKDTLSWTANKYTSLTDDTIGDCTAGILNKTTIPAIITAYLGKKVTEK